MTSYLSRVINENDAQNAIEIAPRVWWVGHYLPGDPFQCHVYLVEHGDQSVLFDPGSMLTIDETLRKIAQVIPFNHIRYFVCHHQDPDIIGAMPVINPLIDRGDAMVITHSRAQALMKHYALSLSYWLVDQNDWRLDLGGRVLRFAFTPYAHFPGAFVSFDERSGTLFSSDLFGGFTEGFRLVAEDEGYFEAMRPFHEHYMPSRDIVQNAMRSISVLPIKAIAPQHGSIIPEPLVGKMIDALSELECGLYLLSRENSNIARLMSVNQALRDINQTMTDTRDFADIAVALTGILARLLPLESLEFIVTGPDGQTRVFSERDGFRGAPLERISRNLTALLTAPRREIVKQAGADEFIVVPPGTVARGKMGLFVPLGSAEQDDPEKPLAAVAMLNLKDEVSDLRDVGGLVRQMAMPLQVAIDREVVYQQIESERVRFYERANRDALTGLYTRRYMQESLRRIMDTHDRNPSVTVGVVLVDIDFFKQVNDTFGHLRGDEVLKKVAEVLRAGLRPSDLPVRLGGEEFAIFTTGIGEQGLFSLAERLRRAVADIVFEGDMAGHRITASFGIALRNQTESCETFLQKADAALYDAKRAGRNRVIAYADCG